MKDLIKYIKAENAKTEKWVAENPKERFASTWTEDESYWKEVGVTTAEEFKRHNLIESIWDLFKEVNGIRPRHVDFDNMSNDELENMIDGLLTHDE